jgi:16S rRNA processing protein RimM
VQGEVLVEIYTDFPERLRPGTALFAGEDHDPLTVRSQRPHKDGLLMSFEGIETPESVGRFRNQVLYVSRADAPVLPEGEYYYHQLIGLNVVDEAGRPLGVLTEVMETGANDVYVVADPAGMDLLLPAIPEVVLEVDLEARRMRVHLLPGLRGEE